MTMRGVDIACVQPNTCLIMFISGAPTRMSNRELAWIDALRGYAVLGVVIVHSGSPYPELGASMGWGARGVQLFFVVSAFTLCLSWNSRHEGVAAFFLRRFLRIAPMFWVALAYYVWAAPAGTYQTWQVAITAAFLHGFHPDTINSLVPGDWSIAVEMGFYLLFPALMVFVTTWKRAAAFFALSAAYALFAAGRDFHILDRISPAAHDWLQSIWGLSLPAQFIAFAVGIFAFWCTLASERSLVLSARTANLGLAAAFVAFAVFARKLDQPTWAFSAIFGIIVICLANGGGRWLDNLAIRHLGKVSFSCYLTHFLFVERFSILLKPLALPYQVAYPITVITVALAACALSSVTYLIIERPMIRLASTIIRASAKRQTPEPSFQPSSPTAN